MNAAFLPWAGRVWRPGRILAPKNGLVLGGFFLIEKQSPLITKRFGDERYPNEQTSSCRCSCSDSVVSASLFYGYQRWGSSGYDARTDMLAHMPSDASVVLYIDLDALRLSPFLAEFYKWAPQTNSRRGVHGNFCKPRDSIMSAT